MKRDKRISRLCNKKVRMVMGYHPGGPETPLLRKKFTVPLGFAMWWVKAWPIKK